MALLLGIRHAGQLVQETVGRVDVDQVRAELLAEDLKDLLALALSHQAVVDMDAGELFADCLDQQGCYDRGIHAAGQGQEHLAVADLRTAGCHLLIDKCFCLRLGCDSLHRIGTSDIIAHGTIFLSL